MCYLTSFSRPAGLKGADAPGRDCMPKSQIRGTGPRVPKVLEKLWREFPELWAICDNWYIRGSEIPSVKVLTPQVLLQKCSKKNWWILLRTDDKRLSSYQLEDLQAGRISNPDMQLWQLIKHRCPEGIIDRLYYQWGNYPNELWIYKQPRDKTITDMYLEVVAEQEQEEKWSENPFPV